MHHWRNKLTKLVLRPHNARQLNRSILYAMPLSRLVVDRSHLSGNARAVLGDLEKIRDYLLNGKKKRAGASIDSLAQFSTLPAALTSVA